MSPSGVMYMSPSGVMYMSPSGVMYMSPSGVMYVSPSGVMYMSPSGVMYMSPSGVMYMSPSGVMYMSPSGVMYLSPSGVMYMSPSGVMYMSPSMYMALCLVDLLCVHVWALWSAVCVCVDLGSGGVSWMQQCSPFMTVKHFPASRMGCFLLPWIPILLGTMTGSYSRLMRWSLLGFMKKW